MNITTNRQGDSRESERIVHAMLIGSLPTLDLGCGAAPYTRNLQDCVWMDMKPHATWPKRIIVDDIRKAPDMFQKWKFGTGVMLDVVEHLHKPDVLKLLAGLEPLCRRVLIFTPLGDLWLTPDSTDPHHHVSGWTPEEFQAMGFHTWTWPKFHLFENGVTHGAFWAWKCLDGIRIDPIQLASMAKVSA